MGNPNVVNSDNYITDERDPFVVGPQKDKRCDGCMDVFYKVYGCEGCGEVYGCKSCMFWSKEFLKWFCSPECEREFLRKARC